MSELPQERDPWMIALFDAELADDVRRLVARLSPAQRLWLSGYLAADAQQAWPAAPAVAEPVATGPATPVATILYGSQSGNCERLAKMTAEMLRERGLGFTLLDMMDCRKSHLQEARVLLVLVSTHGDGEPPDRAMPFHELIHSRKAPRLDHVKYSVLALGDSSYEKFCETGRRFDARLAELGAERLHPLQECDVDFEVPARSWIEAVVEWLVRSTGAQPGHRVRAGATGTPRATSAARAAPVANAYTRKNPFLAPVLTNQRLTARGSTKDVRHIELSLEGSNIRYEPGDALGIVPRNRAEDVEALLEAASFDPDTPVTVDSRTMPLGEALLERFEIGVVSPTVLGRYASAVGVPSLVELASSGDTEALQRYLHGRHLIDLVREHPPAGLDEDAFVKLLSPLAPRLYSIASSQQVTPDEVHLTVSIVRYESSGHVRQGVVSGMLAGLTGEDATVPVYLHRNPAFRLPGDPATPIIMIGPGTGVAPFRAFLAEREAAGATGRNWLFFGDRSFESDFLYQAEWLDWRKRGVLTRIDVAFSRDQAEKVYVQHRMLEQGAQLWAWLEDGAWLYVCGDASRMAPDVHRALVEIAHRHGGYSDEQANEYFTQMQRERRYQRDVY